MNRREEIIELAADIKATRIKLAAMEAKMDSLLPNEESVVIPNVAMITAANAFSAGPLTDRVIRYLNVFSPEAFSAANIAMALQLPSDKMSSLRSTLVRLVDENRINRPEPGKYQSRQAQDAAA